MLFPDELSYHIRTSDVLTHLQSNQVGLLKADAAVHQQERPHKAGEKNKGVNTAPPSVNLQRDLKVESGGFLELYF